MDNTGYIVLAGIVAATATGTAASIYALTLTMREHRHRIEQLSQAAANLIKDRQALRDRCHILELEINRVNESVHPFAAPRFPDVEHIDADDVLRKLKAHAQPASNVGRHRDANF